MSLFDEAEIALDLKASFVWTNMTNLSISVSTLPTELFQLLICNESNVLYKLHVGQ